MAFPVALQLYSVRKEAEQDLKGTLRAVKDMGYEGVEFAGLYGHSPEEVKTLCKEIGLVPISAHVPYAELAADPEQVLSRYAAIGCRFAAVPYLVEADRPGQDGFFAVIENVRKIGEAAKKAGVRLLYHNHDFEFVKVDGTYGLDLLYERVPADLLATELDVCWVAVGGENPCDYLRKYAGRAPVVHLKDYYGEKSENMYELIGIESKAPVRPSNFQFRPLGSGLQDIPAILEAAKDAGAEWVVVEQDSPSMGLTPLECAKKSIDCLRSIGN